MHNGEFQHPRLAQIYEEFNGVTAAEDFFLSLANENPRSKILDLGCGTGRLTLMLAGAGHSVMGIEPALASLEVARGKPNAEHVAWIHGLADDAPSAAFDLALMTNHVAQFIAEEDEWAATLAHLHRALLPGGRLVFDTRDPSARSWETWNPQNSREQTVLPSGETLNYWIEVEKVEGETVTFVQHYVFADSPQQYLSRSTFRFRPEQGLRESLSRAGFGVEAIYGGWQREALGQGDGEYIVLARKR